MPPIIRPVLDPTLGPISRSISRLILASLVGIVVVLAAPAAKAQLTADQKQEMRQHYEKATRAYDIEKYGEAVDEYQKAYEIGGDPAMLYNIAQAYRLNKQYPDALHFYRRYLQRSPNARNRENVEQKISDLEQSIEAKRKANETAAAAARLRAPPPVTPPPRPAVLAPPKIVTVPPPPAEEGGNGMRVAGIVVTSVGVAALITSGVTGYLAGKKGDDLTNASKNNGTFDPSVESSGKTLNTVAIATVIGGGVMAVAGTVLLIASRKGPGEQAPVRPVALAPVVGSGTVGASAALTF